jgi:HAD superfamily hydrolase (TIGR01458 family)
MKSFLIDLDGVLYVDKKSVDGARECLNLMDDLGYDYRFVSNSTRRCRDSVAERLKGFGYDVSPESIFTPPLAAIQRMKRSGKDRCFLLSTGDVHLEFEDVGIALADQDVDFVVVGDAGHDFTFERLNKAFRLIIEGAEILALEQDRYWQESEGLVLSTGPFVAALEYATGKKAALMGKPSPEFFQMALEDMGSSPEQAAMIGDDILTDIAGAQELGMQGILVKTGKYREDLARSSGVKPDLVLESLASLREHL